MLPSASKVRMTPYEAKYVALRVNNDALRIHDAVLKGHDAALGLMPSLGHDAVLTS